MTIVMDVLIVGAGPAGAYCALALAKEGFKPIVLDHSHPREKPCGGGLSPYAQEAFPLLKELPFTHGEANQIQIVYMYGKSVTLPLRRKFVITSRLRLDQHIVSLAIANGAQLETEKVIGVRRDGGNWNISTNKRLYKVKILIGADGVQSIVRKATVGSFQPSDLGMCYGYLTKPIEEQRILLKPLPQRKGYIWMFPRGDHACVGISVDLSKSSGSKTELDSFLRAYHPNLKVIKEWAALIPTLCWQTLRKPIAGSNWMLIGDAAGHVDPVSGEGIPYALRSGELAAEAIFQSRPELYDRLWREDYGRFLSRSARMRDLIFNPILCTPYFILASMISEQLAM
jgi:geranylgeranyl reductase family protein